MDILSARKKAAERAQARKADEPEKKPAPEPQPEKPSPALQAEAVVTAPAPVKAVKTDEAELVSQAASAAVEAAPSQELELLAFRLGEEEYAVAVEQVKEVLKNRELTPVPNASDYVRGVMALRGRVLPVIDLCMRLGLPSVVKDEKSRIVVVSAGEEDAGILVDRVTGVVRIAPDSVRPAPETIERGAEFLKGIARRGDRLYILLDVEKAVGG